MNADPSAHLLSPNDEWFSVDDDVGVFVQPPCGKDCVSNVEIISLPVFFPSFPPAFAGAYAGMERLLGSIPGIRNASTTRVLMARRPADTTAATP